MIGPWQQDLLGLQKFFFPERGGLNERRQNPVNERERRWAKKKSQESLEEEEEKKKFTRPHPTPLCYG